MKNKLRFIPILLSLASPPKLLAEAPIYQIIIKNHLFYPAELQVPANTKIKLKIINQDNTPEEFESHELNREKIILGGQSTILFIGPLNPGVYPFLGEFNLTTAKGKIIAE